APAPTMPNRQLTEPESLNLLLGFGVRAVPTVECPSLAHALSAARAVGYPVVLKGVVEGVAHKSDQGLVHVNLSDSQSLEAAYALLGCANVIVQKMVKGDLEAIAGVTRADGVGLVLLAGLGGIYAEALGDATMWPIPVGRDAVESKLADSSLGRVLASHRWRHEGTLAALVDLLMSLQRAALAAGDRLEAIDVNPVILGAAGAVAVDALVIPRA
ncbi:MAG: acetate--CoA ligase family protein, partial [Rhodospirillales bacterium]